MDNHLLIQNKGRIFLLVKYPDRYHIITVNDHLDAATEEKVISGPCSDAVLDEMKLTRKTVMARELRGVAIGGPCAGDSIILYTKQEKLKYVLSDDYSEEDIDSFFPSIERFQPPKSSGSKSRKADWRKEMQTSSERKIMESVGTVLNFSGIACFLYATIWGRRNALSTILSLLVMATSLCFYFFYPQYFSIMGSKEYQRLRYTSPVKHLCLAIAAPALAFTLRFSDFTFLDEMPLLVIGVAALISVPVVMSIISREIRENTSLLVIIAFFAAFTVPGVAAQINHIANFNPDAPKPCIVTETRMHNGGRSGDRYYCTVTLPSGEEIELSIRRSDYSDLEIDDTVMVFIDQGVFGIEYAYFVEKK